MNEETFLNLSKKAAQDVAEKSNLIFRLVSIDGKRFLGYPEDVRDDRVCIELENNKVTKALLQ
jgi:hypothetical protein